METRRILITGMGGFVGRRVAAALRARGAEVIDARRSGPCDLLKGDDRIRALCGARADTLVHLAWITEHSTFWHSDLNRQWEIATADLVDRFLAAGGRRVIATGTCAEYDWTSGGTFSEDAAIAPHTPYGEAKARTGEAILDAAERHGAGAVWARVFVPFGYGEPAARLIPSMLRACLREEPLSCGPSGTVRDIWDVRNLADALAAIALSQLAGPINVASGEGIAFEEIGALARRITGAGDIIRFGERPLGPGEPPAIVADTTRLRSELDIEASISLEAGFSDYCAALRRNRFAI